MLRLMKFSWDYLHVMLFEGSSRSLSGPLPSQGYGG